MLQYHRFISVETHSNGGGVMLSCDWTQLDHFVSGAER